MIPYFATIQEIFTWNNINGWLSSSGIRIVLILIGAWVVRKFIILIINNLLERALEDKRIIASNDDRRRRAKTFLKLIEAILRVIIWIVAGLLILNILSVDLGPLLAGAGVVGVALAFGTQSVLKDFISGLFIVLENQYRVGDVVDLDGTIGTVEHISIRTTIIRDIDGNVHFVPNGTIMRAVNKTLGYAKINLTIMVGPKTSLIKLESIINKIGEELAGEAEWKKKIIKPLKFVRMSNFTDTMIEVMISGTVKPSTQYSVTGEFRKRLHDEFKKQKISVPQPPLLPPTSTKK